MMSKVSSIIFFSIGCRTDKSVSQPRRKYELSHLVACYRPQPTTVAINHNALLLPQLKGRLNTGILHITYMHSIHTNFFTLAAIFKEIQKQPKIQFIMAVMIFSAKSQVDPLRCLECSPACVVL
jgi:hypothetical protein